MGTVITTTKTLPKGNDTGARNPERFTQQIHRQIDLICVAKRELQAAPEGELGEFIERMDRDITALFRNYTGDDALSNHYCFGLFLRMACASLTWREKPVVILSLISSTIRNWSPVARETARGFLDVKRTLKGAQ